MGGRRAWDHEFFGAAGRGNAIRVGFDLERGRVMDFTVQLECWIEDRWRPIVRYDTAHGCPHRDILDWEGGVAEKLWLAVTLSFNEALILAEDDLKANADVYREQFLSRRPRP